jgi:hypothetical protein
MTELQHLCTNKILQNLPFISSLESISPVKSTELFLHLVSESKDLNSLVSLIHSQSLYTKFLFLEGNLLGDAKGTKRIFDFYSKHALRTNCTVVVDGERMLLDGLRVCKAAYRITEFSPFKVQFHSVSFRQFLLPSLQQWLLVGFGHSVREIEFTACSSLHLIGKCLEKMNSLSCVKLTHCSSSKNRNGQSAFVKSIQHVDKLQIDWTEEIEIPLEATWKELVIPNAKRITIAKGMVFDSLYSITALRIHEEIFLERSIFPSLKKLNFI